MALSQGALDRIADHVMSMYGERVETVTWHHKATPTSSPTTSTVSLVLHEYALWEIDGEAILRTDLRGRIPTADLAFTLTPYDEFVRSDSTRWRVMAVRGGTRHAFWRPQCRQVA